MGGLGEIGKNYLRLSQDGTQIPRIGDKICWTDM